MKLFTTICLIAILGPENGKIFGIILLLSMEQSMMQQHQDPSQLIQLSSILNLIYDCDASSKIAVKTPVGLTDRKEVKKIVAQGEPPFFPKMHCDCGLNLTNTHRKSQRSPIFISRYSACPSTWHSRTKTHSISHQIFIQFRTKFCE